MLAVEYNGVASLQFVCAVERKKQRVNQSVVFKEFFFLGKAVVRGGI
jgi:hypothetical protein